jgi:ankyrin repeat protein
MLLQAARTSAAVTSDVVAAGADVNWRDPSSGRTPLIAAIGSTGLDRAAILLDRGASPSTADHAGRTPMHAAAAATNTGFITMLSRRGADVNAQDREGRTPLMVAADECKEWNVPPLLAAGARVELADTHGRTALQPQTGVGDPKCGRMLDLIRHAARQSDIR